MDISTKTRPKNMDEASNSRRADFMSHLFTIYETKILGKDPAAEGVPFWDMVIISAGDDDQKSWYEQQLAHREATLPKGVPFRVFADPGGVRTGDGGSTLDILNILYEELGDRIFSMKLLLIHAGGFSKRLPSHSCTSKIFSHLPIKSNRLYQMLDLKLLMYLPFMELMSAGMFVTASDDLEGFNLGDPESIKKTLSPHQDGLPYLCTLAHPSTLAVGTGHGVFRLSENDVATLSKDASARLLTDCLEVLQKPSVAKMREKKMVLKGDVVLTDSAYWVNPGLMKLFLRFYTSQPKPINCETSIYSDFMTCQGTSENKEHCKKVLESNQFKQDICKMMRDVKLLVLALPESTFYHFGTLLEYIDAFCNDTQLSREMNFARIVCSKFITADGLESSFSNLVEGVVISSVLPATLRVPKTTIVEHCVIEQGQLELGNNTILSGCHIITPNVVLPGDRVYHTVPIRQAEELCFVTVAFHIRDSLKDAHSSIEQMVLGDVTVKSLFSSEDNLTEESLTGGGELSLWNARLFSGGRTRAESFGLTVSGRQIRVADKRYSMADLMVIMDKQEVLKSRY